MSTERIRTTISLSPEVHEIFKRMAESAGLSVSRCMGDWLKDTADGAQLVAMKMHEARNSSLDAMRQVHEIAIETIDKKTTLKAGAVGGGGQAQPGRGLSQARHPPLGNTGVLVPAAAASARAPRARKS
jgi:hypothetical protein